MKKVRLTHMLSQSSKNDQKKDIRPIKIIRHKQNTQLKELFFSLTEINFRRPAAGLGTLPIYLLESNLKPRLTLLRF